MKNNCILSSSSIITATVILTTLTLGLLIASSLSFAGLSLAITNKTSSTTATESNNTDINNNTKGAAVEKISYYGKYRVQIMWTQSSLSLPKKGFDMEIDFLNASAPLPAPKTVPQRETSIKGESSLGVSRSNVPQILQPLIPVESYDIAIYSDTGKVLWSKVNEPTTAGRGISSVKFVNDYTGVITIHITNIKPSVVTAASNKQPTDSVKFTARVTG
jgi:hypothetical protein